MSGGEEIGSSLAGWFWLRASAEVVIKLSARAGGSSYSVAQSHGWQVGAGCQWEALVPPHTVQSTFCLSECLHSMATGFMQSQ